MRVYRKQTGEGVEVYKVGTDSSGYPKFLVYIEGQWLWRSAKHFTPIKPVDSSDKLDVVVERFRCHLSDKIKKFGSLQKAIADTPLCPHNANLPEMDCEWNNCNECWIEALKELE